MQGGSWPLLFMTAPRSALSSDRSGLMPPYGESENPSDMKRRSTFSVMRAMSFR
jgi:hypothetical protein